MFLCCLLIGPASLYAQEETKAADEQQNFEKFDLPENPHISELEEKAKSLTEGLSQDEIKMLYEIRQSFGITRAIRVVAHDVSDAVKLCAEKNPDLENKIVTRHKLWWDKIEPVLSETEKYTQVVIDRQSVRSPEEVRSYLDLVKKAADFTDNQFEKVPVTTLEACMSLFSSMDNTEENLLKLLGDLEISKPESVSKIEDKEG
jgi:hypothetical protein